MQNTEALHIVFGTGPVGHAVMQELLERGHRVRIVNRRAKIDVPEGVELVQGDATDPAFTREVCRGAAVVYNCANVPYTQWPELFPPLQAGIVEGAASAGAKLIAMENVYMYGPTQGRPLTEDLPYAATTRKGRVRAQMAQELLAAHQSGKVRVASGRASDFFGPYALTSAMGDRVFLPALAGKAAQVVGNPDLPHTYTYVPDIARGLVILGEHDEALGQAWHLPSAQTLTTRAFINMIYQETGYSARIQAIPSFILKTLALFNPMLREVAEMLYEFEEPFIVNHSRFERTFGNHATPLPEAIHTTVEWFRTRKERS
ncbi:MAG: NAD-dependent epimerase/dehydratase family protein [Ktedonobacteraceae bacterium]|nr:NAD-dependent epimerase/dehydratase family protein [Ktedonobacteraceae bacterium]